MTCRARWSGTIDASLLAAMLVAWPAGVRAQEDNGRREAVAIEPAAPHALGRVLTAGPGRMGPTLLLSGGYGNTESVLRMGDAHHRITGTLTIDERPLPWLSFALRLDGRYDAHVAPGRPTDTGFVGDPRLYLRVDRDWEKGLRFGARAGLWMPGGNAPSLQASALSPEILGLASYAPSGSALALTANAGFRLDRSGRSAPDPGGLSAGDRLALEVSAFNQILVGAAATIGRGSAQAFVEASADLLVGSGAPALAASPMFLGVGGRLALGRAVLLESEIEASPSRRPDSGPTAPLVPIPPRFSIWLGVAIRFDVTSPPPISSPPQAPPPAVPTPPPAVVPAVAVLSGRISSGDGGQFEGLQVEIGSGESAQSIAADNGGRFTFQGKPGDAVTIAAAASGYLPARASIALVGGANTVELTLERRPPQGQIRGLVRSLRGAAVAADIGIEPESGEGAGPAAPATPDRTRRRADGGRFEVDVPPGRYRVTISAAGYQTQQRKVDVEENGVTVLNVDLRSER